MLVRGGAYGKTALPRPYRFPVKFLLGIYQEISAPFVSPHRSPQPNDRAQRVSERGSGIYETGYIPLTLRCCISPCHMKHFTDFRTCANILPVYTPLALRDRSGLRPKPAKTTDAPAVCNTAPTGNRFPPVAALSGGRIGRQTQQNAHDVGDRR